MRDWGTVVLLCRDGLTRHVSDERIKELASTMTSSRQVCEDSLFRIFLAGSVARQ